MSKNLGALTNNLENTNQSQSQYKNQVQKQINI